MGVCVSFFLKYFCDLPDPQPRANTHRGREECFLILLSPVLKKNFRQFQFSRVHLSKDLSWVRQHLEPVEVQRVFIDREEVTFGNSLIGYTPPFALLGHGVIGWQPIIV
jgi:hypothetical protein